MVIVMKLVFIVVFLLMVSYSAFAIDLEAGVVKPIAPEMSTSIGLNLGVGLGEWKWNVPVVCDLIGGHKMFADFLYVNKHPALGFSFATTADDENKLRLGFSLWKSDGFEWSVYVRNGVTWTW